MKFIFLLFLLFIGLCLLPCHSLLASDICGDGAGYPDQYPYKNCGGVSTLSWDQENSCEELEDNASCAVAVTGGQGPYTWTISGTGFHFLDNHTRVQSPEIDVFTDDGCGSATITVTDKCGSITGYIRSSDGQWIFVSRCYQSDCTWNWINSYSKVVYDGNYKIILSFATNVCTCHQVNGDHSCGAYGRLYSQEELSLMEGVNLVCVWWANNWSADCCQNNCRLCPHLIDKYEWQCGQ